MKLKALITAVVLGSSTLAMAAPAYARPARPVAGSSHGGSAYQRPIVLASNLQLGRTTKRTQIPIDSQRRFSQLQISAVAGQSRVDTVVITFANGERQVLRDLDKRLANRQALTIDLDGNARQITKIAIGGESLNRAMGRRQASSAVQVVGV